MSDIKILRIGIAPRDYIRERTIAVAKGRPLARHEPRHWVSSLDALARVLNEKNMLLLEMIRASQPQSLTELAELSGRAKSNLSRTLHSMEGFGLIAFKDLSDGRRAPVVPYDKLRFEWPLARARLKDKAA